MQRTKELESAKKSLLQANQYLQNIINLFQEPLQVLEPVLENGEIVDFRFKITNNAYAAYANAIPEDLENKNVSQFFPGYFHTSSFIKVAEVFNSGVANTWDIHYDQDGLDLHNRMSATKLRNEVVVHFTDFTEVKHLQQQLERKIEELERSNQRLEEFVHAASHDLKEPIRKIKVFTTVLKNQIADRLKENELQTFERIEKASHRMELLIEDVLRYSHVSQQPAEKEDVDINEVIKQVQEDLDLDIRQKQAVIKTGALPVVKGYKRQLNQLFQNLISNAIKYRHEDRPIEIEITAGQSNEPGGIFHLIQITDNGIGFEQQYADKIFQMFTRLHGKSEYSGSGVGLSIVKKVIENHNGIIRAESTPGQGSTFKVLIPVE
jgi:light-regulated signal transduction histidine kinase (bacteriophytochrome)